MNDRLTAVCSCPSCCKSFETSGDTHQQHNGSMDSLLSLIRKFALLVIHVCSKLMVNTITDRLFIEGTPRSAPVEHRLIEESSSIMRGSCDVVSCSERVAAVVVCCPGPVHSQGRLHHCRIVREELWCEHLQVTCQSNAY